MSAVSGGECRVFATPEQLALLLRGRFLVDVISYNRVRGLPFRAAELAEAIEEVVAHA